jgi:hypothetical protein
VGHSSKSSGAPRHTPREVNPPEQEKVEPCTSCGKPSANSLAIEPDGTASHHWRLFTAVFYLQN